jgi:putative nucleotidyltransferase with HDIG domain
LASLRIDSPDLRELIASIAGFFESRGVSAWATGGFVRDALLGLPLYDVDITIVGDPLSLGPALSEALGGTYFSLQEERGHSRILLPGRHVHIDLMPLRAPDIEADLRLRDYTIDALAAPLGELALGEALIIDPTGGIADVDARLVRMTDEERFVQDSLRLLRGPRIATQLSFEIETSTVDAIRRNASGIATAAAERQRDELVRIFSAERAGSGVRLLDELGLFSVLLPEMEPARGVEQPSNHHYYDVLGHSFAAVDALDMLLSKVPPQSSPQREIWEELWDGLAWCGGLREYILDETSPGTTRSAVLKFCGLLHDMAKPQTKSIDKDGRMRFFGHSDLGAEMATRLMQRLRFPTRDISLVARMIDAHLRPLQLGQQGPPSKRAIYRFFRDTKGAGIDTLFLAMADHLGSVGPRVSVESFRAHVALTGYILHVRFSQEQVISPTRLIDGDDVMAALGVEQSELIGDLLEAVREAQAGGDVVTREQALELARAKLAELTAATRE